MSPQSHNAARSADIAEEGLQPWNLLCRLAGRIGGLTLALWIVRKVKSQVLKFFRAGIPLLNSSKQVPPVPLCDCVAKGFGVRFDPTLLELSR